MLIPLLPYDVAEHHNGDAWVSIDDQTYSPQELSALILTKMKSAAEDYFGDEVTEAVTAAGGIYELQGRITTPDVLQVHFDFEECPVTWNHRIFPESLSAEAVGR